MTVAQVERYAEGQIREHYLRLKSEYIQVWDKVMANHVWCLHLVLVLLIQECSLMRWGVH